MYKLMICVGVLLAASLTANAVTVYAPNGLERPLDGPDSLITFDTNDPTNYTTVGSMNVPDIGFGGMDFDADGNLWAYASLYKSTGGAAGGLYSVNMATGQATPQGTLSTQSLDDIAFNPVDGQMYGIRSQFTTTRLFTINLTTGAVSLVGSFTGLPQTQRNVGFAIDSQGAFYLHDVGEDVIYKGDGMAMSELYQLTQDTNFQQGMTIDWSRDDMGYHPAVGYGEYPHYFSQLNTFTTDGSSYVLGPEFGPDNPGDGLPPVECGDVAVVPIPEPSSLLLLLSVGALLRRR
ncbi:MAG: PEP-CTERM sorting domain-containing protein [Phycisphaerae bacterium]|jgi:hypothetical protein